MNDEQNKLAKSADETHMNSCKKCNQNSCQCQTGDTDSAQKKSDNEAADNENNQKDKPPKISWI